MSRIYGVKNPDSVVNPPPQPPDPPTALVLTDGTANHTVLSWNAPAQTIATYQVYRNGTPRGTSVTTSFVDTATTPLASYDYTVQAVTAGGLASVPSAPLHVTINANQAPVWDDPVVAPNATVNAGYSFNLNTVCDDPEGSTMTYSVVGGALPHGLTMNSAGLITGVATAENTRRYVPGHYLHIAKSQMVGTGYAIPDNGSDGPWISEVVGVICRYKWNWLETSQGVYDISRIVNNYNQAAAKGKMFMAVIEMRTFDYANDPSIPLPPYLAAPVNYFNGVSGQSPTGYCTLRTGGSAPQGYQVWRWNSFVQDRLLALHQAIATALDGLPFFGGMVTEESTAGGMTNQEYWQTDYTVENIIAAFDFECRNACSVFANSRYYFNQNFIPGNPTGHGLPTTSPVSALTTLMLGLEATGVTMGGSDLLPDSSSLLSTVYPRYTTLRGKMPLWCSCQHDSYKSTIGGGDSSPPYWTMRNLFLWGVNNLFITQCFWDFDRSPTATGANDWPSDGKPVAAEFPVF